MRTKDIQHAVIAHTHRRARKIARHFHDVECRVGRTDKDIALLYQEDIAIILYFQTATQAGCNHVHLQSYGGWILQHLDIVYDQDVFVEITGRNLCALCKFAFLYALFKILQFLFCHNSYFISTPETMVSRMPHDTYSRPYPRA